MQISISILVTGKVQGVFFRQSTKERAIALGLTGKVMNQADGSVQIIATGSKENLDTLVQWCWQGPPSANVKSVAVESVPFQDFEKFIIVRLN